MRKCVEGQLKLQEAELCFRAFKEATLRSFTKKRAKRFLDTCNESAFTEQG